MNLDSWGRFDGYWGLDRIGTQGRIPIEPNRAAVGDGVRHIEVITSLDKLDNNSDYERIYAYLNLRSMTFDDEEVKTLDPTVDSGLKLLLEHLCGEPISLGCSKLPACNNCQNCMNLAVLRPRLKSPTLTLEDLNDILLLVDQFPIGGAFFEFFLSSGERAITFDELKNGVVRFKGFALLKYGNVRFAYRSLYKLSKGDLAMHLGRWHTDASALKKQYANRRNAPALPKDIPGSNTWMLGYIAKGGADKDLVTFAAMESLSRPDDEKKILEKFAFSPDQKLAYEQRKPFLVANTSWKTEFKDRTQIEKEIGAVISLLKEVRGDGWRNTSHYLASDSMDVYVATSMRERWEFEDVHNVVGKIFADPKLAKLKLRYFDPTQSFLDNRVDKGLVEALMLKRAECTVYLVQETDTFGKDSELATTLAQGKPVIAYVPKIEVDTMYKTAMARPLSYLQKRLSQLAAEEKLPAKTPAAVYNFLEQVSHFQPYFRIVGDEESAFLDSRKLQESKQQMLKYWLRQSVNFSIYVPRPYKSVIHLLFRCNSKQEWRTASW